MSWIAHGLTVDIDTRADGYVIETGSLLGQRGRVADGPVRVTAADLGREVRFGRRRMRVDHEGTYWQLELADGRLAWANEALLRPAGAVTA